MSISYIFGSGASRCAGYPVTFEVMDAVFREYKAALYADENSKYDIDVKLSILKAVQKEYDVFKIETKSNNIELFIKWISKNGLWPRVFPIAGIIYWYLWDRMHNISTIRFHKLFASRIKPKTQIVDFNYDLVLEQAIETRTLNYPVKYDYISGNEDKIVIYKPMGSINWVIDKFNLDSLVYNEGNIIFGPQFVLDRNSGVWLVPEYCLDIAESTGGTFQFMKWFDAIPLDCDFYNKTIEGCVNVLSTSNKIIVFGYSFPLHLSEIDHDILTRIFNRVTLTNRVEIELVCGNIDIDQQLANVDSYKSIEKRLRLLFGLNGNKQSDITINISDFKTFEEWCIANNDAKM